MTDLPGEHPLPHPELQVQTPLIFTLKVGDVLYRHYQSAYDPIYFGMSGNYRFDDPDCPTGASFGVLYVGEDPHCCFIESCGSTTGVPAVSGVYLDAREIARIELTEELRFVDLASSGGLTHVGAGARLRLDHTKSPKDGPPHCGSILSNLMGFDTPHGMIQPASRMRFSRDLDRVSR
jgi:hypothetical protein